MVGIAPYENPEKVKEIILKELNTILATNDFTMLKYDTPTRSTADEFLTLTNIGNLMSFNVSGCYIGCCNTRVGVCHINKCLHLLLPLSSLLMIFNTSGVLHGFLLLQFKPFFVLSSFLSFQINFISY